MRLYYSHSMLKYGTVEERKEIKRIKEEYKSKKFSIINPAKYQDFPLMEDFLNLLETCDALVFSEYKNWIGRGVYREIIHAKKLNIPIWFLKDEKIYFDPRLKFEVIDNDWSIEYAKVKIRKHG